MYGDGVGDFDLGRSIQNAGGMSVAVEFMDHIAADAKKPGQNLPSETVHRLRSVSIQARGVLLDGT